MCDLQVYHNLNEPFFSALYQVESPSLSLALHGAPLSFYILHHSSPFTTLRLFLPLAAVQEVSHDVHGHGEDDGRVVLRRDAVQRLQVAKLQGRREICWVMFKASYFTVLGTVYWSASMILKQASKTPVLRIFISVFSNSNVLVLKKNESEPGTS